MYALIKTHADSMSNQSTENACAKAATKNIMISACLCVLLGKFGHRGVANAKTIMILKLMELVLPVQATLDPIMQRISVSAILDTYMSLSGTNATLILAVPPTPEYNSPQLALNVSAIVAIYLLMGDATNVKPIPTRTLIRQPAYAIQDTNGNLFGKNVCK